VWIVKIVLSRPYAFIVLALVILILSPVMILRQAASSEGFLAMPGERDSPGE
jgi:hypothetical protein